MPLPHLEILTDPDAVALRGVERIINTASEALRERGAFTLMLAGGSTPRAIYKLISNDPYRSAGGMDWSKVEIYFGDERCVPPDHPESNYRMAVESLLGCVAIPAENIHRISGERDPEEAAKSYGQLLKARFGDGGPDLTLLGMGDDGHTASIFPYSEAGRETHHRCVANLVEKSTTGKSWRVTTTAPFINRSREVLVIVTGASKAARLQEVLHGAADVDRLPIQRIRPASGGLLWMVDRAAAARLDAI